ncbi:MAG: GAF domain-containing protein, partial [Proteobacteria bacterium]|nr:GAF domain-containing protein [Pseudomonadota bacterium]
MAREFIPFDRTSITLVDHANERLVIAHVYGEEVPMRSVGNSMPLEDGVLDDKHLDRANFMLNLQDGDDELVVRSYPSILPGYRAGARSFLTIPLFSDGQTIGLLRFRTRELSAYSESHLLFAERIARQISGAIGNAQMLKVIQREAEERKILAEIGRVTSFSLDLNDVFVSFAEQVRRLIKFDRVVIGLIDEDLGILKIGYVVGPQIKNREVGDSLPLKTSHGRDVIRNRKGVLTQETDVDKIRSQFPGLLPLFDAGIRSFITLPLISNDRVIGTFHLQSVRENAYSAEDMNLVERICTHVAGAVNASRLHSDLRQEALERQVLAEIGRIVSASLDMHGVYDGFAEQVNKLIPFDRIIIRRLSSDGKSLLNLYAFGLDCPGSWGPGDEKDISGTLTAQVLRTRN